MNSPTLATQHIKNTDGSSREVLWFADRRATTEVDAKGNARVTVCLYWPGSKPMTFDGKDKSKIEAELNAPGIVPERQYEKRVPRAIEKNRRKESSNEDPQPEAL